ncbi:MAG: VWA domain-containing protein [Lachnospiraceae bacterium]|nr:VWA domain-containing protein [Lachnospiraceae bacterium]
MKKRFFALCAIGMVMLSGCGSSGTAPAEVADNAATGGAAAVETYTPVESVASESSMDYGFSEPAAAAAAEAPASAAAKMDTTGVKQPNGGTGTQQPGLSGVLTAAEYSDLENWDFFKELVQDQKITFPAYGLDPTNAVSVTVTDNNQQPLAGETVTLLDGQGSTLWETITDGEGKAWLFYDTNATPATVSTGGQDIAFADEVSFVSSSSVQQDTGLQVMFILDTTGSMGDELNYLKEDFTEIVNEVSGKNFLFSANFYRDQGDAYVTKCNPFTSNTQTVQQQFDAEDASGGGDTPEAVADILYETMVQADWKDGYRKVAFMIFDAPPHDGTEKQIDAAVRAAAAQGIHVIPVVASNAERDTELFGRALAIMTNSEYVFLTDDSGVGDSHLEPIIGNYTVESLHDIIVRLIKDYEP